MAGVARDLWVRVALGDAGTLVPTAAPVRIQQQLEGAVTTVAEVTVAGFTPVLATNEPVVIHHVNRNNAPEPDYESRQLFAGIVNRIGGVGSPHGVTLSCTGELAKLRRTRTSDYVMQGKTDTEVARDVLTYCGVAFEEDDIWGWGYTLGLADLAGPTDPWPVWRAGQSGAAIIGELDRVFACATIERNDGSVVRFMYSRSPEDYVDPPYTKTFARGRAGASFYGNERDRGDLDQVFNYWIVRGISYTVGEGEDYEGCTESFVATANADHAKLGPGVDVGPQEFSSDLIDSEALAKAVAERLMRWHNREPDLLRIQCGNDARLAPGHIVLVRDASYGIDVPASKRYLVLAVARDGDEMLIDCVGGPPGETGTVVSHLYRDCNGTETDVGTDPPPFTAPDPMIPDIPDIGTMPPDLPEIEEPPPPPNTDDPYIDCTEVADGMEVVPVIEGGRYVDHDDLESSNYRASGSVAAYVDAGLAVEHIALKLNGTLTANDTDPLDDKEEANDTNVAGGPGVVTVAGEIYFRWDSARCEISITGDGPGDLRATLAAAPGAPYTFTGAAGTGDDETFQKGVFLDTENSIPIYSPYGDPHQCDEIFHTCNNGGLDAEGGLPVGEWLPFSFAFDFSGEYQRITYSVGGAGGYMEDLRSRCVDASLDLLCEDLHYDVCAHAAHTLTIAAVGVTPGVAGDEQIDEETWQVRLRNVVFGHDTCEANPDYEPPEEEDF